MTVPDEETGRASRYRDEPTQKSFAELTARELHDILALRSQVFIVEQTCVYNDIDGRDTDTSTAHVWFEQDGEIAAYLRQLDDGDGVTRIGRVVTSPDHRGQTLAGQLVAHVVAEVGARQSGPIVLDAQAHLADWYAQFGFARAGEEFIEDGIPHVPMRMNLPIRRGLDSHPVE